MMKMLEAYKGLDYVVVYVEKGVDPIMVLSSNGELLLDSNGAQGHTQGVQERGNSTHEKVLQIGCVEQGGNAICGTDIGIIDINLSDIDIIVDDIGNDSDNSAEVIEGEDVGKECEGSEKSSQN